MRSLWPQSQPGDTVAEYGNAHVPQRTMGIVIIIIATRQAMQKRLGKKGLGLPMLCLCVLVTILGWPREGCGWYALPSMTLFLYQAGSARVKRKGLAECRV